MLSGFLRIRYWDAMHRFKSCLDVITWNFGNCADTKYCRMLFFRIYFVYQLLYYIFVVPDVNVNWGDTQTYCQCCCIWAEPGTCSTSPDWIVYRHASDGHKVHASITQTWACTLYPHYLPFCRSLKVYPSFTCSEWLVTGGKSWQFS